MLFRSGKEYTFESTLHRMSVGDLYFSQEGKPRLRYTPKEDITPFELARMIQLFAIAFVPNIAHYYDYWKYIEEHNLMRHFSEV